MPRQLCTGTGKTRVVGGARVEWGRAQGRMRMGMPAGGGTVLWCALLGERAGTVGVAGLAEEGGRTCCRMRMSQRLKGNPLKFWGAAPLPAPLPLATGARPFFTRFAQHRQLQSLEKEAAAAPGDAVRQAAYLKKLNTPGSHLLCRPRRRG